MTIKSSEESLPLNTRWRHRRSGYEVCVRCHLDFKESNDARWTPAVGYTIDGRNGKTLARSEVDFLLKFERIEE